MLGNWNRVRGDRIGVMMHYDDSSNDKSSIEWLTKDERCHVSYNTVILDDGTLVEIAPINARAWHAGVCQPSSKKLKYKDANSAFYGFALAADGDDDATPEQIEAAATEIARLFKQNNWPCNELWRITDHESEAWPRGRKIDVYGDRKTRKKPVLDLSVLRTRVSQILEPVCPK